MCSGIQGNRQVVVQSEAFYQPNEQRAIARSEPRSLHWWQRWDALPVSIF